MGSTQPSNNHPRFKAQKLAKSSVARKEPAIIRMLHESLLGTLDY